jgi:hypothetical protein
MITDNPLALKIKLGYREMEAALIMYLASRGLPIAEGANLELSIEDTDADYQSFELMNVVVRTTSLSPVVMKEPVMDPNALWHVTITGSRRYAVNDGEHIHCIRELKNVLGCSLLDTKRLIDTLRADGKVLIPLARVTAEAALLRNNLHWAGFDVHTALA